MLEEDEDNLWKKAMVLSIPCPRAYLLYNMGYKERI